MRAIFILIINSICYLTFFGQREDLSGLDELDIVRFVSFDTQSSKENSMKILHNFQTSLYKKELLNEANQKLQWEKKQSQERRRDQERLFNKEKYVAYAWANSETGMKSGITWWDMTESERAHYREKYYEFVFSRKKSRNVISPESIISRAWAKSRTGRNLGKSWAELSDVDKVYYRSNFQRNKNENIYLVSR
jgi:hypothetical protein